MNEVVKKTVSSEGYFLQALFMLLETEAVRYAVMRNYHQLPYSAEGSDLDIIVAQEDGPRTRKVILEAIREACGTPIGIAESVGFFKVYAFGGGPDTVCPWWGLRIDVNVGLFFKGHCLLADGVTLPVLSHNGIQVLEEGFAAVLGVLKEVLNNGFVPARYAQTASVAASEDWAQVSGLLAPLGKAALGEFKALLLSSASLKECRTECQRLRRGFLHASFSRRPLYSVLEHMAYEWSKFRRYIKPPGIVVAILGVDGAGKSSVINDILPILGAATHNRVVVQHLRPGLLPPLRRLKFGERPYSGPVVAPHESAPSGVIGSLARLSYLTFDYVIGYWLWTRPKIAKQPTVVIFDRYAYDLVVDPRRFRIALSRGIRRCFAAFAPRPDLFVCLHGDPEKITARKNELSLDETWRQVEELRFFARSDLRAVLISTDIGLEETRDQVLQAISGTLRARSSTRP